MKSAVLSFLFVVFIYQKIWSSGCERPIENGYMLLKEWDIDSSPFERSYVMTAKTTYLFSFCGTTDPKGELIVEDANRKQLLKLKTTTQAIEWQCESTGIRYVRFVNLEKSNLRLCFKKR